MKNKIYESFGVSLFITIYLSILCWSIFIYIDKRLHVDDEIVSIHMYNERNAFVKYLMSKDALKTQIIKDLLDGREIDNELLKQIELDENVNISYDSLIKVTNNYLGEWYMSINYMYMDNNHDSTFVENSDTYKTSLPIINSLTLK